MNKITCVYYIEINGKKYIGSTKDYNHRIKTHLNNLLKKTHHVAKLQKAFDESLKISHGIIKRVNEKTMRSWESYYIGKFDTIENGYNSTIPTTIYKKNYINCSQYATEKDFYYSYKKSAELLNISQKKLIEFIEQGKIKPQVVLGSNKIRGSELLKLSSFRGWL